MPFGIAIGTGAGAGIIIIIIIFLAGGILFPMLRCTMATATKSWL